MLLRHLCAFDCNFSEIPLNKDCMKKILLCLVTCLGLSGTLTAQTKTVTGTVTGGDDGLGIPRANVTVKGTTRGTPTDLDGNYAIEVSADETLVFSFIGYITQEILVSNQTTIDVVLQPDVANLSLHRLVFSMLLRFSGAKGNHQCGGQH